MKTLFKLLFRIIATFLFLMIGILIIFGTCFIGGFIANHFGVEPILGSLVNLMLLGSIFIGLISQ